VHEAIYRCINEACGRPTPRPVNFCPWCGTAQAHAHKTGDRDAAAPAAFGTTAAAAAAATAAASTAAARPGWSDAPLPPEAPLTGAAPEPAGAARPAAPPSATEFGRSGKPAAAGPASTAQHQAQSQHVPRQEVPRPPLEARPAGRAPIRLRWWLVALVLLWGVWLLAKPPSKKIERQIDQAVALARECKGNEAQAELIALRKSRATPDQLERLQQTLNDEAAKCTRRRQRGKAWSEASGAVETALAAASWDKARARLQAFTRRWGEDEDTRVLKTRIEDLRREDLAHRTHPLAVPQGALASGSSRPGGAVGYSGAGATGAGSEAGDATQFARNLIDSARRDLARGDFGAAADKMTLCLTMVDAGNRDCRALKAQAEQEGKFQ
jgi:hypothetical protein